MNFRLRLNPHAQFGSKGMTLLHAAALRGESKLVSAFGHCRFDSIATAIDFPDFEGNTALHIAVIENNPQVSVDNAEISSVNSRLGI